MSRTGVKNLGLTTLLLLLWSSATLWAQEKVAYVDTDAVITSMPAYTTTQRELETFQAKLVQELEAEKRSIAQYYTQVIEAVKAGSMTAKQQQDAEKVLQQRQADYQLKTTQADQRLLDKERLLTGPMYEQFEAALAAIAKENKYVYILDKKMTLYSAGGIDATSQLKKELGI